MVLNDDDDDASTTKHTHTHYREKRWKVLKLHWLQSLTPAWKYSLSKSQNPVEMLPPCYAVGVCLTGERLVVEQEMPMLMSYFVVRSRRLQ